mgnify:CR=1 FL=1
MKAKPARTAFPDGVGGDKAWAKATREAASDFVLELRPVLTDVLTRPLSRNQDMPFDVHTESQHGAGRQTLKE